MRAHSSLPVLASIVLSACSGDTFAPSSAGTGSGGAAGSTASSGAGGSGSATGGSGEGAGAQAGTAAGGPAGGGGEAGAAGTSPLGGSGGSGGSAGIGGSDGSAGKADGGAAGSAGAGGKPGACVEAGPPPVTATFRADCAITPALCVLPTKVGARAYVTATTCGVGVAHALEKDVIGITFPERANVSPTSLAGATFAHGIAMSGPRLLVGTAGDSLVGVDVVGVGASPTPFQFTALATATTEDKLPYRSLVATKQVIAWTGRQGYEIFLLAPDKLGCSAGATDGKCTEQRALDPQNPTLKDPAAGWGVASIDKKVFWSNKIGLHATVLGSPTAEIESTKVEGMQPGSLAIVRNHVLMAREKAVLIFPPNLGNSTGVSASFAPSAAGSIRDIVAYGNDRLVVLTKGIGAGALSVENKTLPIGIVTIFNVAMPATSDPLSVTAGPDAVYVGCADGAIYRFPFEG